MGQPRKSRKKYNTPPHPWNAERIKNENKLMKKPWQIVKIILKYVMCSQMSYKMVDVA